MLAAGYIDRALIAYGANQRSAGGRLATPVRSNRWEAPYHPLFPASSYALAASRHMHDYGTTRAQLAEVAVAARRWADTNPEAFARGPLTIDEVLAARMLSSPLSVRDCCLVTDGAAALLLTRTDRARGGPKAPVAILGAALYSAPALEVTPLAYLLQTLALLSPGDLWQGLAKSLVFALLITLIGVSTGFAVTGGAEGVGRATTRAVVLSICWIIVVDMVFSFFLNR